MPLNCICKKQILLMMWLISWNWTIYCICKIRTCPPVSCQWRTMPGIMPNLLTTYSSSHDKVIFTRLVALHLKYMFHKLDYMSWVLRTCFVQCEQQRCRSTCTYCTCSLISKIVVSSSDYKAYGCYVLYFKTQARFSC